MRGKFQAALAGLDGADPSAIVRALFAAKPNAGKAQQAAEAGAEPAPPPCADQPGTLTISIDGAPWQPARFECEANFNPSGVLTTLFVRAMGTGAADSLVLPFGGSGDFAGAGAYDIVSTSAHATVFRPGNVAFQSASGTHTVSAFDATAAPGTIAGSFDILLNPPIPGPQMRLTGSYSITCASVRR